MVAWVDEEKNEVHRYVTSSDRSLVGTQMIASRGEEKMMMYHCIFPTHFEKEHAYLTEACPARGRRVQDSRLHFNGFV